MPTAIKAAVLYEPNTPLRVQTVTLSDPKAHEVRIALRATGLCHTDFNFISGSAAHYLPVVLGHEGFGVVEEVGPGVTAVEPGDTVIPYVVPDCGECEPCRSGLTNNCLHFNRDFSRLGESRLSHNGQPIAGLMGTATFAEQTVVHERHVVKVNPAADPALACCLACGVTTGVGAALKTAGVRKGSTVAVFGLGGVGLGVVQVARLAEATTIVAIDTNPSREAVARDLGATHFLDARSRSLVDHVKAISGRGVQYAFDCVGRRAILKQALAILDRGLGGVVVSVGVLDPGEDLTITAAELTGATITRSFMGGANGPTLPRTSIGSSMAGSTLTRSCPIASVSRRSVTGTTWLPAAKRCESWSRSTREAPPPAPLTDFSLSSVGPTTAIYQSMV